MRTTIPIDKRAGIGYMYGADVEANGSDYGLGGSTRRVHHEPSIRSQVGSVFSGTDIAESESATYRGFLMGAK